MKNMIFPLFLILQKCFGDMKAVGLVPELEEGASLRNTPLGCIEQNSGVRTIGLSFQVTYGVPGWSLHSIDKEPSFTVKDAKKCLQVFYIGST